MANHSRKGQVFSWGALLGTCGSVLVGWIGGKGLDAFLNLTIVSPAVVAVWIGVPVLAIAGVACLFESNRQAERVRKTFAYPTEADLKSRGVQRGLDDYLAKAGSPRGRKAVERTAPRAARLSATGVSLIGLAAGMALIAIPAGFG